MKSLRLFTGNRLDLLTMALPKVMEAPLASPLEQEIVLCAGVGMIFMAYCREPDPSVCGP
jgi:hypothetical protein